MKRADEFNTMHPGPPLVRIGVAGLAASLLLLTGCGGGGSGASGTVQGLYDGVAVDQSDNLNGVGFQIATGGVITGDIGPGSISGTATGSGGIAVQTPSGAATGTITFPAANLAWLNLTLNKQQRGLSRRPPGPERLGARAVRQPLQRGL